LFLEQWANHGNLQYWERPIISSGIPVAYAFREEKSRVQNNVVFLAYHPTRFTSWFAWSTREKMFRSRFRMVASLWKVIWKLTSCTPSQVIKSLFLLKTPFPIPSKMLIHPESSSILLTEGCAILKSSETSWWTRSRLYCHGHKRKISQAGLC